MLNKIEKMTIKEILANIDKLEWSDSLFLPDTEKWSLETQGIIHDPDDIECEEDEVPLIAKENNLFCSINIGTIQDIADNVKQQIPEYSIEQLFDAFVYYWDNDSFIDFDEKP